MTGVVGGSSFPWSSAPVCSSPWLYISGTREASSRCFRFAITQLKLTVSNCPFLISASSRFMQQNQALLNFGSVRLWLTEGRTVTGKA